MVISFSSEKPRARLLAGHKVFTVRRKRRKQFIGAKPGIWLHDWANEKRLGPKIADVIIHEIGEIRAENLPMFVKSSGFDNVIEWSAEIERINRWTWIGAYEKFWLYNVAKFFLVAHDESFFKRMKPSMVGANE